jgi:hypothetical protein
MVDRTWIGGGDNEANNPDNWSPEGSPAPGDNLLMPNSGTMNIQDNDLADNTLQIGTLAFTEQVELNLSQHADVSVAQLQGTLVNTTINVTGKDTLSFESLFPSGPTVIVNLQPHARLTSDFDLTFGSLTVNGGEGAGLINNQADVLNGTHTVITSDVLGIGSFRAGSAQSLAGFLEFGASVSRGLDIRITGDPGRGVQSDLKIDQPREFRGSVSLGPAARIDLAGLAAADSYTFQNDMLSIYSNNRIVDRLRLANDSTFAGQPHDLAVSKVGSDVWVTERGLSGPPAGGTELPLHT